MAHSAERTTGSLPGTRAAAAWTVPSWSACTAKARSTCTASACPWCWAGGRSATTRDLSYVDVDNVGGARMAVQYLLKSGHATVATVAGPPDMSPGVDRLRGYRTTMADAGLSDFGLIVFGDFGRVSAEHAVVPAGGPASPASTRSSWPPT